MNKKNFKLKKEKKPLCWKDSSSLVRKKFMSLCSNCNKIGFYFKIDPFENLTDWFSYKSLHHMIFYKTSNFNLGIPFSFYLEVFL